MPGAPRKYTTKAKNAQEAHEAIRPTDLGRLPKHVARYLEPEQARLYELIWKRTVASQMESAELERTTVDIAAQVGPRKLDLRATGQVVKFDGFLTLYQEGKDDDGDDEDERPPAADDRPAMPLERRRIDATQHFTEPPPRYSEASWSSAWRSSASAGPRPTPSIARVLRDREYVRIEKKRLVPEDKGRLVTAFLESFFRRYVEYDFTADLEEQLDRVSNSEIDWKQVLRDFWRDFSAAIGETKELRIDARCSTRSTSSSARTSSRDKGDGCEPARLPDLRQRPALAEARQVRRLHRLLELSRMQATPASSPAPARWRRRGASGERRPARRAGARRGSRDRPAR